MNNRSSRHKVLPKFRSHQRVKRQNMRPLRIERLDQRMPLAADLPIAAALDLPGHQDSDPGTTKQVGSMLADSNQSSLKGGGPVRSNGNQAPVLSVSQTFVSGNVLSMFTNSGTWSDPEGGPVAIVASLGTVTKNGDGTWAWSFVPSQSYANQSVTITASDNEGATSQVQFSLDALVAVVNSRVFYKGSSYSNTSVNAALDTSKVMAKSGASPQTLSFANVISTSRGINGLVFDVAGLSATSLNATDFSFRMSPLGFYNELVNPPSSWGIAPSPSSIHITPGTSTSPARLRLEWTDNSIADRWLQIKVLANANTGLLIPQVYYIGHLLGEINGLVEEGAFRVQVTDANSVISQVNSGVTVPISNSFDINKDGRIRGTDSAAVVAAVGRVLTRITIPASGSSEEGEAAPDRAMAPAPGVQVSKVNGVSEERLEEIRSRLTDEVFHVPLLTELESSVAQATSERAIRIDLNSAMDANSILAMSSLDEYFQRIGKDRSLGVRSRH